MSFSFQPPEEDPVCECKYDEIHDRMDREDCAFHCDMAEDNRAAGLLETFRKPAASDSAVALPQGGRARNG